MINTPEDWWNLVEDNWLDLMNILEGFLPLNEDQKIDSLTHEIVETPMTSLRHHIELAKAERNRMLVRYLNAAWTAAPDKPSIHSIPAWGILCDLCSEEWVFDEDMHNV